MSAHFKFSTRIATFLIFQPKKVFENSLNTFEDIAFVPGQCNGKSWNFTFSGCWKAVKLLLQNQNVCALQILNQYSHIPYLSAKKSFWKFVKYFWRYSISAGWHSVRGKVEFFTCSGCWKSCNVAIANLKCLCISNFRAQ